MAFMGQFGASLVRAYGRPMRRRLIKAHDKYKALSPARIRASKLHQAYRRKK